MWLVAPDTEILTTDGRMEQIQDIRIGDTIVGRGGGVFRVMNCWRGPESEPMLKLYMYEVSGTCDVLIYFLRKSTFMIYLIHDNSFFSLWDLRDWIATLYNTPMLFVYKLVKWTLATFAAGVVVYICYCVLSRIFKKCRNLFARS